MNGFTYEQAFSRNIGSSGSGRLDGPGRSRSRGDFAQDIEFEGARQARHGSRSSL